MTLKKSKNQLLKKSIPLYVLGIIVLIFTGIIFIVLITIKNRTQPIQYNEINNCNDQFNITRLNGFKHIKPLLFAEREYESSNLAIIKQNISDIIDNEKKNDKLISASVYIRVFNKGEWISINSDSAYHPASLTKVPILITYLHMIESNNLILNQKILYEKPADGFPTQQYVSKQIKPGTYYTIQELLNYMIAYSDNNATFLLLKNINLEMYNKTYTDIGLPKPSFKFEEFTLTAKQYSLFLKELYNASYLSIPASEYAVNLLTQCDFKEGLVKKLPPNTIVAHKFGENGYGSIYELHESGIVYIGDNAYLITIMTKGTDSKYLCNVVADISYAVFSKITFD